MWIWPEATIRDCLGRSSTLALLILAAAGGVFLTTVLVAFRAPEIGLFMHPVSWASIGALGGAAGLYMCGAFMWLAGTAMGGRATPRELRQALAWTTVANALASTLVIAPWLLWVAYGSLLSQQTPPGGDWSGLALLIILLSPLGFWGLFVSARAFGAVLKIGTLRALLCVVMVGGLVGYTMVPLADMIGGQFPSFLMPNEAMLPTIRRDERFLRKPTDVLLRGDIVVFERKRHDPHSGIFSRQFVRRVIGLPGDVIGMDGGVISINGQSATRERVADFAVTDRNGQIEMVPRFREALPNGVSYEIIDSGANRTLGATIHTVAGDQIFLLGDNRDDTDDMQDTYDTRSRPAHPGIVWLDRVSTTAVAVIERVAR